ncbi:hypothetical protein [Actinoplanes sp. N902-109]|uniref:hypothetical protein n=1 Tax=Actinoplanes sp. (strain N902-109) TaxID=649831 RepID=UPI0012FCC03E|nr:hypothetical protein [Actinoplanes sp. N902-109]
MAYVFPPMDEEPPPDYCSFVAARLGTLHRQAFALTGGHADAAESITTDVLTDVAGHWRRLRWQTRLLDRDAIDRYLHRRLEHRTKLWREDQPYPVDVIVQPPPQLYQPHPAASVAHRLAALLPSTVRTELSTLADAEIAWVHAYRRAMWHRYARVWAGSFLLLFGMIQVMSAASGPA